MAILCFCLSSSLLASPLLSVLLIKVLTARAVEKYRASRVALGGSVVRVCTSAVVGWARFKKVRDDCSSLGNAVSS